MLKQFLEKGTSPWHVSHEIHSNLKKLGFQESRRASTDRFFLTNGASTAAILLPKNELKSLTFFVSHVDSPALKMKPLALWDKHMMSLAHVEPYGQPILSSWFGKPLSLTGAYWTKGKKGVEMHLVDTKNSPTGVIPHLAIHLDRGVNEKGHMVDPHKDLHVLLSPSEGPVTLKRLLQEKKEILFHDLSFVPQEGPHSVGLDETLLVSPRLDNLLSVFSLLEVLKEEVQSEDRAFVFLFYNHEEVGSRSDEGAESRLFLEVIESLLPKDPIDAFECNKRSLILSLDMSHAFHPSHEDSSDPRHTPELGKGVMLKISAEQKYSGGCRAAAEFIDLMKQKKVALQMYSTRNGLKSGSTVGPILASQLGIATLDIGIGVLGMHSSAEVASYDDVHALVHLLQTYCRSA